jgi:hypothetical protein
VKYLQIDPRPASLQSQIELFTSFNKVVFFEGTHKPLNDALAGYFALDGERTFMNIDPQHTGGNVQQSCIMAVYRYECGNYAIPNPGVCYATVRCDLDSVGAMAIAAITYTDDDINGAKVEQIHQADTLESALKKKWQPHKLSDKPAAKGELAALASMVSDFKLDLEMRVGFMAMWLCDKPTPFLAEYAAKVQKESEALDKALKSGEIKVSQHGKVCYVESAHRAATSIGYQYTPVVIAFNPNFPDKELGSIRKFTICQWGTGYVDLLKVWAELSKLEPGWGGSPVIGGSPQGVSSKINPDDVIKVVKRNLI